MIIEGLLGRISEEPLSYLVYTFTVKPENIGSTLESLFEETGETLLDPVVAAMPPWEIVRRCRWTPEERALMNAACTCQVKDGWNNICHDGSKRVMRCEGRLQEWARLIRMKRELLTKRRRK